MNKNELSELLDDYCYTKQEAADILGLSMQRLGTLIQNGKFTPVPHPGTKLFLKTDVHARLEDQEELRKRYYHRT